MSRLLKQISDRADQIGVSIERLQTSGPDQGPHYTRRTFDMTVIGTYHEIARFLTGIGSLPRIITPIDLSVIPRNQQQNQRRRNEQQLEASFVIETYVLPEPGAATANQGARSGA